MLALVGVAVGAAPDARACSFLPLEMHTVDPARRATDAQPPALTGAPVVTIRRGTAGTRGCDGKVMTSSCDDSGSVGIELPATDDQTAPSDLGFRVALKSGTLPAGLAFQNGDFRGLPTGGLAFHWTDGASNDQESFSFVLSIAPIDAAGNVGQAVDVPVSDGGGGGCAVGRARPRLLMPLLLFGMWLPLKVQARRARSATVSR
jgi:hypothetical protein